MSQAPPDIDVSTIPSISRDEAMSISEVEADRFAAAISAIGTDQWHLPTACSRWDVADLVAHVVGSARAQASPREFVRQVWAGRPIRRANHLAYWWDGMNEVQVGERRGRSPDELASEWSEASAAAINARRRLPRVVARLPLLDLPEPIGRQPLSYLFDMGFTRDVWAHRIDLAVALGVDPDLDDAHDRRVMADIVAEWAATHGQPFVLRLDGPAGGWYSSGSGGEIVETTVVHFVRCLTEREPAVGLLSNRLPL